MERSEQIEHAVSSYRMENATTTFYNVHGEYTGTTNKFNPNSGTTCIVFAHLTVDPPIPLVSS